MTRYALKHPRLGYLAVDEDSTMGNLIFEDDPSMSIKFPSETIAEEVREREGWSRALEIVLIEEV